MKKRYIFATLLIIAGATAGFSMPRKTISLVELRAQNADKWFKARSECMDEIPPKKAELIKQMLAEDRLSLYRGNFQKPPTRDDFEAACTSEADLALFGRVI